MGNTKGNIEKLFRIKVCVQEIKRLLRQSDMSIKEVCAQMNFPSLSFFCKYTKQHLGVTANEYRLAYRNNGVKRSI